MSKKEALSVPATGREVALISSDGQKFFVPPSVVRTSRVLGKKLKDIARNGKGSGQKSWDKSFALEEITGATLGHVIRWARHHKGGCVYKVNGEQVTQFSAWDDQFVSELEREEIFKLSLAAKDLEIEGLLQLVCKEIARMISGKTAEEVRSEFGLVSDFTPEEEEEIRRENELLFGDLCGDGLEGGELRGLESINRLALTNGNGKKETAPVSGSANGTRTEGEEKKNDQEKEKSSPKQYRTWFEPNSSCRCRYCLYYYTRKLIR